MFQVTRKDENRLDILFSGKLDSDGMRAALNDLVINAEGIEHGHMLCRVGEFDIPTLGVELEFYTPYTQTVEPWRLAEIA